jgi:hypothetical protein
MNKTPVTVDYLEPVFIPPKFILCIAVCCVAALTCISCGKVRVSDDVQTIVAQRKDSPVHSTFCGRFSPVRVRTVTSPAKGVFSWIIDPSGEKLIKAGTEIARVQQPVDERRKANTEYAAATEEYELAEKQYRLQETQFSRGTLSKVQLEQSRIELNRKRNSMEGLKRSMEPVVISAPFDGVPSGQVAENGAELSEGSPVFEWADIRKHIVLMDIPSWKIPFVIKGKSVAISGPLLKETLYGTVESVAPVDLTSGNEFPTGISGDVNIQARARIQLPVFPDSILILHAGSVTCTMTDTVLSAAIVIPLQFVEFEGESFFVRVKNSRGQTRVSINTGLVVEECVEVVSGLNEGDTLVKLVLDNGENR